MTTVNGLAPPGYGHLLARRLLDSVGLGSVPVVAGAEQPPAHAAGRRKAAWELTYTDRLTRGASTLGIDPVTPEQALPTLGDAAAAADAIVEAAKAVRGDGVILALGALTNLAEAAMRPARTWHDCAAV